MSSDEAESEEGLPGSQAESSSDDSFSDSEEEEEDEDERLAGSHDAGEGSSRRAGAGWSRTYLPCKLPPAAPELLRGAFGAVLEARSLGSAQHAWAAASPIRAVVSAALVAFCEGRRDGWRVDELRYALTLEEAGPCAVDVTVVDRVGSELVVTTRRVAYAERVAARVVRLTRLADPVADLIVCGLPSAYAGGVTAEALGAEMAAALAGLCV